MTENRIRNGHPLTIRWNIWGPWWSVVKQVLRQVTPTDHSAIMHHGPSLLSDRDRSPPSLCYIPLSPRDTLGLMDKPEGALGAQCVGTGEVFCAIVEGMLESWRVYLGCEEST